MSSDFHTASGFFAPSRQSAACPQGQLEALRRREHGALVRFYTQHSEKVDRLVFRLLGPDQDHQDVVQEIFLHAVEGIDRFRGPYEALEPWLIRIALNRTRRHIRSRVSKRWLFFLSPGQMPQPAVAPQATAQHAARRAQGLMMGMKTRWRFVFVMRALEQMTFPEIAAAMEISEATAKRDFVAARSWLEHRASQEPAVARWLEAQRQGGQP